MIEVTLNGYKYNYCKTEQGNYWLGVAGYEGSLGRYTNCRVPTMLWTKLRERALEEGYSKEDFSAPKPKEKVVRSKPKKASRKKNSISIF